MGPFFLWQRSVLGWVNLTRIMSAHFSAIMMVGALVLEPLMMGMMDASATRKPSMPRTLVAGLRQPGRQCPFAGADGVVDGIADTARIQAAISLSDCTFGRAEVRRQHVWPSALFQDIALNFNAVQHRAPVPLCRQIVRRHARGREQIG